MTSISAIGGDQGTCGNNTKVACEPIWIRVDPKAGQSYVYAGQGDSGSPVFAWNTAFGILTNSAHYFGSAQSLHVLYTSIDDVYSYSYALAY